MAQACWQRFIRFRVTAARENDPSCQGIHFGASQEKELRGLQDPRVPDSKKSGSQEHLGSILGAL